MVAMAAMQSHEDKDAADDKDEGSKASAEKDGDRRKGRRVCWESEK